MMIITVTLNPSLDKTLSVPSLQPGTVHRARIMREDLGGKGINVSRALQALGIDSKTIGFVGGRTGQELQRGLLAAGLDVHFIDVGGETRRNITLLDEASGQHTKINEPGPTVSPHHVAGLGALVERMAQPGDLWAFSGSLPPGTPSDIYASLIWRVQERGGRAFLDTSGLAFREGLLAHPFAIKPNSEEAAEFLQHALHSDDEHRVAARHLQAEGVELVALTRGAQGLVLAVEGEVLIATPPPVAALSPIGAGDAVLAGLLWAVSDGCGPVETARRAVACGTATAMQGGTGVGDRVRIETLLSQIKIRSWTSWGRTIPCAFFRQ